MTPGRGLRQLSKGRGRAFLFVPCTLIGVKMTDRNKDEILSSAVVIDLRRKHLQRLAKLGVFAAIKQAIVAEKARRALQEKD
jgi:hypothetical protein